MLAFTAQSKTRTVITTLALKGVGEGVFMIPLSVTLFVSEDWDDGDEGFTRVGLRIISGSYLMKNQVSAF